jgi:hypothetical protein
MKISYKNTRLRWKITKFEQENTRSRKKITKVGQKMTDKSERGSSDRYEAGHKLRLLLRKVIQSEQEKAGSPRTCA